MSRVELALRAARDTRRLEIGRGAAARAEAVFREQFPGQKPFIVADVNTLAAVGGDLLSGVVVTFHDVQAEWTYVERLQAELAKQSAVPVAIGAGTINDLVKLAAHRLGRPYMCVATAASMDGYTAYGASITKDGSKQTFDCSAPRAVIADIDVIEAAPCELTASGYADLLAKITAGADWILADALGIERIEPHAWETVQGGLRDALVHPIDIQRLTEGLLMSGFAMQSHQTSRPASGAEHQFSHLWDMQHATDASHGFKVGIGTLAVAELYERILQMPVEDWNVDAAADNWPDWSDVEQRINDLFDQPELREKALQETRAKWVDVQVVWSQLVRLTDMWPELKRRLSDHLLPVSQMKEMLHRAGAPTSPEQIGISPERLHRSFKMAYHIRRRFTVLDLAERLGVLP